MTTDEELQSAEWTLMEDCLNPDRIITNLSDEEEAAFIAELEEDDRASGDTL